MCNNNYKYKWKMIFIDDCFTYMGGNTLSEAVIKTEELFPESVIKKCILWSS